MFPVSQESDSLSSLEDRVQRAVQLVTRLRQEKDTALAEAAEARAQAADAQADADKLKQQVKTLEAERSEVRSRIERLLEQIDQLNG
jgi:uncharacterized coiled-coil DUF342 family protein